MTHKLHISLPDDLHKRLLREIHRRRLPLKGGQSQAICEGIEMWLGRKGGA